MTTESEDIQLVLSVDKADLDRQLNDIFGETVGRGTGGGGGMTSEIKPTSGESGGKGIPVQPGAGFIKHLKHLAILIGIPLSLAALIKSSKLMSGALGAIQSIVGAMVDSFLAPFMPKMAEGIAWLAEKGIPAAVKAGEATLSAMGTLATALGLGGPSGKEQASAAGKIAVSVTDALFPGGKGKKGAGSFWRDVFGGGSEAFAPPTARESEVRGQYLGSKEYLKSTPEQRRSVLDSIRQSGRAGALGTGNMFTPSTTVNLNIDAGSFDEAADRGRRAMNSAYDAKIAQAARILQENP